MPIGDPYRPQRGSDPSVTIPPGQRVIDDFPRFGVPGPAPSVPHDPVITISGALAEALILPVSALTELPRHKMAADFHCVAGWTATDLHWEGVAFADLYHRVIEPTLPAGTSITHVVFGGLDGFRSIVTIEDALAPDVLLAEHLNGESLTSDHGAPIRLVSPQQYGFVSTKHLCEIGLHTTRPREIYHPRRRTQLSLQLLKPHPRARVWHEERHRYLPGPVVRPVYHTLIRFFRQTSARGGRPG
jgi:DMSO/TMAO reductase YedYZ molybdopterin-dependent catalytic subunit